VEGCGSGSGRGGGEGAFCEGACVGRWKEDYFVADNWILFVKWQVAKP
jgi:hypothetical protein